MEAGDGLRVLVARYRPRGLPRGQETWSAWLPQLGPSKALHAAYYGKRGAQALSWETYAERYLQEMEAQTFWIRGLAQEAANQELTLLCSSACVDVQRCHRTLLRGLIAPLVSEPIASSPRAAVVRRKPSH
jgi:uncharacterized protein YeaO (DUF488 family)